MSRTLEDVQDEILDQVHAGQRVDREAILAEHPEHTEALTAFFEVLAIVEGTPDDDGLALARLGEFRIVREIGRGGMGRIYEAEQTSLKRRVALKVLPPTLRLDARLVSRFRREAEAAGRLRHPGIVPVFSVGEAAGTPFFAMELVDGVSLHQVLEKRRAGQDAGLPTEPEAWRRWAVETAAKVGDALAYAHENGILHRDVKPGNILLDESGAPRLTDFGLALDLRAPGITQTGEVFGSPQYMSPEQALRRESPVDERTDVYSLAVTLYELLTLRLPYDGTTSAEVLTALVAGKVVPPRRVDASMPRALERVLLGALTLDPRSRYRRVAEFAQDLRAAVAGSAPTHTPPVPLRKRLRAPLAVLAALALAALGIALWPDGGAETVVIRDEDAVREALRLRDALASKAAAAEASARLLNELTVLGPAATPADFEVAIARLRGVDSPVARDALRQIYEAYIRVPGANDPEARAFLGYREFTHEVPESISFRQYPYVRAVERAHEKRWFGPDEEEGYRLAEEAWEETTRHAHLLLSDRVFRAADRVRAGLGMAPEFAEYHLTTRWAGPFLLCHLGSKSVSRFDTVAVLTDEEAGIHQARVASVHEVVDRRLARAAGLLTALSQEFTKRYGEALLLKPLMDPWGGRPDLPPAFRSFEDGVPLVVLVAESRDAWSEGMSSHLGGPMPPGLGALFLQSKGRLFTFVEDPDESEAERKRGKFLHEAVHQLQWWYRRQRSRWGQNPVGQSWLDEGMAEYLAGVVEGPAGTLEFTGLSPVRLGSLQGTWKQLQQYFAEYPLFPVDKLISFNTFKEAQRWATQEFEFPGPVGRGLFYDQAWALTYFLHEAEDGRYLEAYNRYVHAAFNESWFGGGQAKMLRDALGIETEKEFEAFEYAFRMYVRGHLLRLELEK